MPIPTSKIFEKLGSKLPGNCKCGRVDSIIHCPFCGSTSVIVLKRLSKDNTVLLPDGSRSPERVFGCKQCSKSFPETACFRTCEAPSLTWQRESEVAEQVAPRSTERLSNTQMDMLRALAKKNPAHAEKIKAKLGESGLLEQRDAERVLESSVNSEAAKLFQPAVASEEEEDHK